MSSSAAPFPSPSSSVYNYTASSAQRARTSTTSIPAGFDRLLNPLPSPPPPSRPQFRLIVRQQPVAARACGGGDKVRRSIDPIPIVQLLISDFSPTSKEDNERLAYKQYVVSCELFSISSTYDGGPEQRTPSSSVDYVPPKQESKQWNHGPDAPHSRSIQVLFGRTYVSPFFVETDPEPARAPAHPRSIGNPSPIPNETPMPSTFFIFPDLCVRLQGSYRLKFRLIDVGGDVTGRIPVLDEAWSQPFQVYSAKNFPGMTPTPYLAQQLKQLGAAGIKLRGSQRTRGDDKTGEGKNYDSDDVKN